MTRKTAALRAGLAARRLLGWPARRVLDRRIEWILAALDERVGGTSNRPNLQHRLDLLEAELRHVTQALGESLADRRLASLEVTDGLALPGDSARFLNWAEGPEGPAARAELWFNPPVPVRYAEDAVDVLLVNERIVEQPYVFGALAGLPRPGRILDVGGAESTLALSLASLGHEVHVVDPRGYRLEHPGVHPHAIPLDELPLHAVFDAAVALSSIEHFGLGAYGAPRGEVRLDHAALSDIRERLTPSGVLVLTVPCAPASSNDDFQRIYSLRELREMLSAWNLVDLSVAWRRDRVTWVRGAPEDPPGPVGVALVTACRRA
jgi:SAM-dependent methyltransferase